MTIDIAENADCLSGIGILFIMEGETVIPIDATLPNTLCAFDFFHPQRRVVWVLLEKPKGFGSLFLYSFR